MVLNRLIQLINYYDLKNVLAETKRVTFGEGPSFSFRAHFGLKTKVSIGTFTQFSRVHLEF